MSANTRKKDANNVNTIILKLGLQTDSLKIKLNSLSICYTYKNGVVYNHS